MTQFQESVSVPKLVPAERAYKAPFLAIAAGLFVLLMALAVTSFIFAGQLFNTSAQGQTTAEAVDGWMPALIAAGGQQRLAAAQHVRDGWSAALVTHRSSASVDGWEAALIRPHGPAVDGYIQRFLIDD